MSTLYASYKNELSKLIVKKKYIVFLVIGVLFCIGRVGTNWAIKLISQGTVNIKAGNLALDMIPFFAEVFVPLIIFMLVADLFCSEMHDNTIRASLMTPVTRLKLLTSKILACFTVATVQFISVLLACTIIQLVLGQGDIVGKYFLHNVGAYILDLVPMLILVIMGALINLISKSPTLAMFLSVLIYAIMKYCNYFISGIGSALFTSYNQWHKLWLGTTLPFYAMSSKIFLLLGSGILFYSVAYYLFEEKDY